MRAPQVVRRILVWTIAAIATLIVAAGALLAAIDAGHGRALLIRYVATRSGRRIQIDGVLQIHLPLSPAHL